MFDMMRKEDVYVKTQIKPINHHREIPGAGTGMFKLMWLKSPCLLALHVNLKIPSFHMLLVDIVNQKHEYTQATLWLGNIFWQNVNARQQECCETKSKHFQIRAQNDPLTFSQVCFLKKDPRDGTDERKSRIFRLVWLRHTRMQVSCPWLKQLVCSVSSCWLPDRSDL